MRRLLLTLLFLLSFGQSPGWAFGFIQGTSANTSGGSATLTFGSAVTAGSTLVAVARIGATGDTVTFSDNVNSGNYTIQVTQVEATDGHTLYMAFFKNSLVGTPTVTVTSSLGGTIRWFIGEYGGTNTSAPVDISNSSDITPAQLSPTGVSATTGNANDVVITALTTSGTAGTITDGSGFTNRGGVAGYLDVADKVVSATGPYSESYTTTGSATYASGIMALKQVASGISCGARALVGVGC